MPASGSRDTKVHPLRLNRRVRHAAAMEGAILEDGDLDDVDGMTEQVRAALLDLRSQKGRLTIDKFAGYPILVRVCGGGDLLDGFFMFRRELQRYQGGDRDVAAAAWSLTAEADSVLDRLQMTAEHLSEGDELRDQRSARRWSDDGMPTLARELVYFAHIQQRLGQEMLTITVERCTEQDLALTLDQLTAAGLPTRAPLVRVWHYDENEEPIEQQAVVDLDKVPAPTAAGDRHVLSRYRLQIAVPRPRRSGSLLGVSVEGRDAPARIVTFYSPSNRISECALEFRSYRTIATLCVTYIGATNE